MKARQPVLGNFWRILVAVTCTIALIACGETSSGGNGDDDQEPEGPQPTIVRFSASPSSLPAGGGSSTLSWTVTDATSLSIDGGVGTVTGPNTTVSVTETTVFTLTATNAEGSSTASTTVTVANSGGNDGGDSDDGDNGGGDNDDGDNGGGNGSGTTSKQGFVFVTEVVDTSFGSSQLTVDGFGLFQDYQQALPVAYLNNPFADLEDTCTVSRFDPTDVPDLTPGGPVPGVDFPDPITLDAGNALTLTANGSTYATLSKDEFSFGGTTFISYGDDDIDQALPAGLTLDIPGAAGGFPSFSNVSMGTTQSIDLTSPSNPGSITPNTTFTWNGAGSSSLVTISASALDPTNPLATISLSCLAIDDGSFSFSNQTRAEMGADFVSLSSTIGRQSFRTETKDDALLIIMVSSVETFGGLAIP